MYGAGIEVSVFSGNEVSFNPSSENRRSHGKAVRHRQHDELDGRSVDIRDAHRCTRRRRGSFVDRWTADRLRRHCVLRTSLVIPPRNRRQRRESIGRQRTSRQVAAYRARCADHSVVTAVAGPSVSWRSVEGCAAHCSDATEMEFQNSGELMWMRADRRAHSIRR